MSRLLIRAQLLSLVALVGAFPSAICAQRSNAPAAVLPTMGNHTFRVSTKSREAQKAFDRGLILAYAFGHEAAQGEFREATELDPKLAMAWWGISYVNGPHINFPLVPPEKAKVAWDALTKAQELAPGATPLERDLISALAKRYANPQPEDRSSLDEAYAAAMREVWKKYPRNADVATLFAESLMDLHPWDMWTLAGKPQPWTPEILATLGRALRLNPRQPGANHLLVHAVEASPNPQQALVAAYRLQTLVPGSSHLVHMPAHIFARVGMWGAAAKSNVDAMKIDALYRVAYPNPGFYAMYMAHNAHFLAFTAMMRGRSGEALKSGRQMVADIPPDFLRDFPGVVDGFLIFNSEVLMRFGRWNEILAEPKPPEGMPYALAMWHFTRAVAFNALDRPDDLQKEAAAFRAAAAAVPADHQFGNSKASDLLDIATHVLNGEIAARAGKFDESIAELAAAVKIEDTLRYNEPPDWLQPVRHTLGAVLLRAKKYSEAEAVYRADLQRFPENGWALYGLGQALRAQGRKAEAAAIERRFAREWASADVKIDSTCYCQPGIASLPTDCEVAASR